MRRRTDAQLTFADAEFMAQGVQLDPRLQVIADLLSRRPDLTDLVQNDLVRGLKKRDVGRDGLNASRTLRSLILQRVYNCTLRELAERVADGYTLRMFTGFRMERVPKHDAFNRAFNRIRPETLDKINEVVVRMAVDMGVEDGTRLRVDSTVVETNIHYPSDSALLLDVVRTINRLVKAVKKKHPAATDSFKRHAKAAKKRAISIARREGGPKSRVQKRKYEELIKITMETVSMALLVVERGRSLAAPADLGTLALLSLDYTYDEIEHFVDLGRRVIFQAKARVLEGRQLRADEKIVSIFEPHTDIIKRGKANRPVEFGHKIFLAETKSGLITEARVLKGNPTDDSHVKGSIERHEAIFRKVPDTYAADRGFFSPANLDELKNRGVRVVSIPRRAPWPATTEQTDYERSSDFRLAQRFRCGIEGRISVLLRGRGLRRCLQKGLRNFQCFLAAGVLANNLLVLAAAVIRQQEKKRRSAA